MNGASPRAQLDGMIAKLTPEIVRLTKAVLGKNRRQLPPATEAARRQLVIKSVSALQRPRRPAPTVAKRAVILECERRVPWNPPPCVPPKLHPDIDHAHT
jgi:hypothetical protein